MTEWYGAMFLPLSIMNGMNGITIRCKNTKILRCPLRNFIFLAFKTNFKLSRNVMMFND